MSIIDRMLQGLGYAKIQSGAVTERVPLTMAGDYQWERDPSYLLKNNELYNKIGWIFSATNAAAEFGAAQKVSVAQMMGEDDKDVPNHPFETLLRRPNPLMSRAEFLAASFSYYILAHNSYWWINKPDGASVPVELWIIPPGQITPICDDQLFISHYEYIPRVGVILNIPVEQIAHVKRFNPQNPFVGAGLFETVKYQVNTDYGALRNQAAIQNNNNGTPPGILAFAEKYIDSDWARIKAELATAAKAMMKYMPLRGVGAGGVQWLPNALSDREMQVIEKRAFTRDEIYQIIAPGYLNMMLPNATEANAKTGKATFTEFVIYPMLNTFAEKITNDLLPIYGPDLVCKFDEVRTKDRALELQEMAEYSKTHTMAEVRKKYYGDAPLGDERDNLLPSQVTAQSASPVPTLPATEVIPALPEPIAPVPTDEGMMESDPEEDDMIEAEVKRWKRVTRKALKAGRAIPEFVTEIIPANDANAIRRNLKTVTKLEQVEAAFDVKAADPIIALATELRLAREALAL